MNIENNKRILPIVPLRGICIFPHMSLHFDAGREKSILALEEAMENQRDCLLVAQKDASITDIDPDNLHRIGTIAKVKQILKMPGNSLRVLVEGVSRAEILSFTNTEPYFEAEVEELQEPVYEELLAQAYSRSLCEAADAYSRALGVVVPEVIAALLEVKTLSVLTDKIAGPALLSLDDKQLLLEQIDPIERAKQLLTILERETAIKRLEADIQNKVKQSIEKGQKEYFLREQIRVIRGELGENESTESEADEMLKKLEAIEMPKEEREKVEKEIKRYSSLQMGSHEAPVLRTWLDWIFDLPWGKYSKDSFDLSHARSVLDRDHFGLDKVKERVIEHLAVCQLRGNTKGSILCLVGPPGVGKTSVASSIAEAVGRNFVRISLGGVRDEAEIRGHRRTYIGAIPGRVISAMKQAGSMNPLMLLDEIDKLGSDHRGDPSAAMLEVLDSAQNYAFRDHYLEVPFDLSRVMFIVTANTTETIPRALLDRMEVVELSSYTEEEKIEIGIRHLLPKQIKEHSLDEKALTIPAQTMRQIVLGYTREAGVRNLERQIAAICRKAAVQIVMEQRKKLNVTLTTLPKLLGPSRFSREANLHEDQIGVVNGLAWTSVGGEMLCVEATVLHGKGHLQLTGQLGDVMKESAQAAFTFVRAHAAQWGIDAKKLEQVDVHIHIPEGAIPKDGPSAGITMATAMVSALSGTPVRGDVAMTGEITLLGKVLPIGGLKEKCIAAQREGMRTVIIPSQNKKDLVDVPEVVRKQMKFVYASKLEEVLRVALAIQPTIESEPSILPLLSINAGREVISREHHS